MQNSSDKRFVICSSCAGINRVPKDRWNGNAKCGSCQSALDVTHAVFSVSAKALAEISANSPVPVIVDFWAPWCGPCIGFAPVYENFAKTHSAAAIYLKLNTEADPNGGSRYGIRAIPTLIVFADGKERARMSGALPAPQFAQWLSQNGVHLQ